MLQEKPALGEASHKQSEPWTAEPSQGGGTTSKVLLRILPGAESSGVFALLLPKPLQQQGKLSFLQPGDVLQSSFHKKYSGMYFLIPLAAGFFNPQFSELRQHQMFEIPAWPSWAWSLKQTQSPQKWTSGNEITKLLQHKFLNNWLLCSKSKLPSRCSLCPNHNSSKVSQRDFWGWFVPWI